MPSDDMKYGNDTGALSTYEQEAVDFFRDYKEIVCNTLRYTKDLKYEEEWSSFLVFLRNLDNALCKSSLNEGRVLFRGVRGGYAERLLFLLDIPARPEERPGKDFTPHILQDPSYITFSSSVSAALETPGRSGSARVLFVYQGLPEDNALLVGGKDEEVLFPRNIRWLTTGYMTAGTGITCISLEQLP
jgi:hypothetical protein